MRMVPSVDGYRLSLRINDHVGMIGLLVMSVAEGHQGGTGILAQWIRCCCMRGRLDEFLFIEMLPDIKKVLYPLNLDTCGQFGIEHALFVADFFQFTVFTRYLGP